MAWQPLVQFSDKNLTWAKMLAEEKSIQVIVENRIITLVAQQRQLDSGDNLMTFVQLSYITHRCYYNEGDAIEAMEEGRAQQLAPQDAYLHVDIYKVDQVIRNLITNAVSTSISLLSLLISASGNNPAFVH